MSGSNDGMPSLPPGSGLGILDRFLDRIERAMSFVAGLVLLAMGILITASVAAREQIGVTIPDDILLVGLSMVAVVCLPLSHVQRDRGQISVTVITDRLPWGYGACGRILGHVIGTLLFGAIAWLTVASVPQAFAQNHYYDGQLLIPVWPVKVVFGIGMGLFAIRLALCAVGDVIVCLTSRGAEK
ncbi:TRAP transporter small permease [Rhodospirillaceae bacterium KN72]|uniref:TRAP transporter small permease protein n=1 Tax=Pacificispira spongiicola TaxID=2729598 RepID=A0A7Y0HGB0_9PROT|nr:TRAP transporter small permease [Pacificispira spongiicola]NMM44737.1 TRAP transporter small permease [Pacificispira spongiicola]